MASVHAATNQLVLTAHHLVIDGYSWNVVIDDIRAAYDGDEVGRERVTYGDHVAAFRECDARPQSSYWLRQMQADAASTWALEGVNDYSDEITLVREVQGARGRSLDDLALASLLTALVRGGGRRPCRGSFSDASPCTGSRAGKPTVPWVITRASTLSVPTSTDTMPARTSSRSSVLGDRSRTEGRASS
ncbi:hypothetical protein JN350_10875 [Curtobacterium sp. 24E2]|nr:hypothetical protein JN350_10875 [Curtobacterium sp. 24E2]